jgi:hypothetical protein
VQGEIVGMARPTHAAAATKPDDADVPEMISWAQRSPDSSAPFM